MVAIKHSEKITKRQVYECVMDYTNPLDDKVSYKKGDLLFDNEVIDNINDLTRPFFKLVGGKNITHKRKQDGTIVHIKRRPVEIGDVYHVMFSKTKYKHVVVMDIDEEAEMAMVYPSEYGFIPLGPLCRQTHKGWIGVNYSLDFSPPSYTKLQQETVILKNKQGA